VRITPDKSHTIAAISNNTVFVNLCDRREPPATLFTAPSATSSSSFDGQYAFVSNFNSSVIDVATRTIVQDADARADRRGRDVARRPPAVGLNSRFKEDVHVYDIHGAAGFVEGFARRAAPPPEGGRGRSIAVSKDGKLAVVGNDLSRGTCASSTSSRARSASWIPTGDRVLGVAISPDSTTAVVCNGDSDTVSVIALATDTVVATLSTPSRPRRRADLAGLRRPRTWSTVAGTDAIYFLHLAGAASSVLGLDPRPGRWARRTGTPTRGRRGSSSRPTARRSSPARASTTSSS
jgi:YVTN family beta-propeller protein